MVQTNEHFCRNISVSIVKYCTTCFLYSENACLIKIGCKTFAFRKLKEIELNSVGKEKISFSALLHIYYHSKKKIIKNIFKMNNNKKNYNIEVCFHCKFIKSFIMALFLVSMKKKNCVFNCICITCSTKYYLLPYTTYNSHSYYSIHLD